MILQVHELISELKQEITTTEFVRLYAIRLHLYKHLNPTGSLTVEIRNAAGEKITETETIAISAISTADYFHGYVRFLLTYPLKNNTVYYIVLKSSGGYSFSESAYIGWCNDLGLQRVHADYTPNVGTSSPLGLEIWSYENTGIRGNHL